jgi:hypothetical protein
MKREHEMQIIHVAFAKIYQYKSVTFELHEYFGPTFLRRKDFEPRSAWSIQQRQWSEFGQWFRLSADQREEYRLI